VLDGVLHGAHSREVPLDVTDAVVLAELLGCRAAEGCLELTEVSAEEVDDDGVRRGEFGEDLGGLDRREEDRVRAVRLGVLDVTNDIAGARDGVDERNRVALESDAGKVREEGAAEGFGGDAGAVGEEIGGAGAGRDPYGNGCCSGRRVDTFSLPTELLIASVRKERS
jgi:hypothetical protein